MHFYWRGFIRWRDFLGLQFFLHRTFGAVSGHFFRPIHDVNFVSPQPHHRRAPKPFVFSSPSFSIWRTTKEFCQISCWYLSNLQHDYRVIPYSGGAFNARIVPVKLLKEECMQNVDLAWSTWIITGPKVSNVDALVAILHPRGLVSQITDALHYGASVLLLLRIFMFIDWQCHNEISSGVLVILELVTV